MCFESKVFPVHFKKFTQKIDDEIYFAEKRELKDDFWGREDKLKVKEKGAQTFGT